MESVHGNQSSKNGKAETEPMLNADQSHHSSLSGNNENKKRNKRGSQSIIGEVCPDGIEVSMSPYSAISSLSESNCTVTDDSQSLSVSKKNMEFDGMESNYVPNASEKDYGYSDSISEVSCNGHPSTIPVLSPTRPPPMQSMERPDDYDPSRIPSSVFLVGTSPPNDWSATSNDSLFSIGIGRNSATKEQETLNSPDLITPKDQQNWKPFNGSVEAANEPKELPNSTSVNTSNEAKLPEEAPKKVKQKKLDLRKNRTLLKGHPKYAPARNTDIESKTNEEEQNAIQHSVEDRTNKKSFASPINKEPSNMPCCECSSNCSCRCISSRHCSWFCCMFSSKYESNCCSANPCWSCKWSCDPSSCCKCCPSCSKCSCSPTLCCKWLSCCPCSRCSFSPSCCCCKWPSSCSFPDFSFKKCISYCCSCIRFKSCRRMNCCFFRSCC